MSATQAEFARYNPYYVQPAAQADAGQPQLSMTSLAVIGVLMLGVVGLFAATVSMDLNPDRRRRSRASLRR